MKIVWNLSVAEVKVYLVTISSFSFSISLLRLALATTKYGSES